MARQHTDGTSLALVVCASPHRRGARATAQSPPVVLDRGHVSESGAARSHRTLPGTAPGARWGRVGEDARHHHPHRPLDGAWHPGPQHRGPHLHQQGRHRDGRARGRGDPRARGQGRRGQGPHRLDVPLLRPAGALAREEVPRRHLHHLRPGRSAGLGEGLALQDRQWPGLRRRRHLLAHFVRQERLLEARGAGREGRRRVRRDHEAPVSPLPGGAEELPRLRLRRSGVRGGPGLRRAARHSRALAGALLVRAGGRVPGHQRRPAGGAPADRLAPRQPVCGGRRRSVHLRVARRRRAEHPAVRGALSRRQGHQARAELSLAQTHPRRGQRGHRQARRRLAAQEGALHRQGRRREGAAGRFSHARGRGQVGGSGDSPAHQGAPRPPARGGGALSLQQPGQAHRRDVARARGRVPRGGRSAVLRTQGSEGRARLSQTGAEPRRRDRPPPGHQLSAARHRRDQRGAPLRPCRRPRLEPVAGGGAGRRPRRHSGGGACRMQRARARRGRRP